MKKVVSVVLVLAMTMGITACGNSSKSAERSKELNVLLYPEYVPEEVIEEFEKETGIQVNIDYIDNDTMIYSKWSEDPKGYDLSQPAISTLHALIEADMLKEINLDNVPNDKYMSTKSCDATFTEEDGKYAIPYNISGGYTWIYNPDTCPIEITSLDDLVSEEMKGQIVTMPYSFMWYPVALKHLGYSEKSTDPNEIAEATEWVKRLIANVKVFDGATPSSSVKNGECSVAMSFASDASKALLENPSLKMIKTDDMLFTNIAQYWVVGKESPNAENAEKFINYICNPENYAKCLSTYPAISANDEALNYVTEDYKSVEDMFTIPDDKQDSIVNLDISTEAMTLYDEEWNKLMTE